LTADVEGKEWVKTARPKPKRNTPQRLGTPLSSSAVARSESPASLSQKERNEAYFARLHNANESRPADLPPSQGGKYAGFGSTPAPAAESSNGLGLEDITRDPVAALTKGWGFFTTQATKAAQIANEQVLKPTAQKLAEADLAKTAASLGQGVSGVGKLGYENLSRFVEGPGAARRGDLDPEYKDFWEGFGDTGTNPVQPPAKPSALGTSAMKKPASSSSSALGANSTGKKEDGWDNDDWDKF